MLPVPGWVLVLVTDLGLALALVWVLELERVLEMELLVPGLEAVEPVLELAPEMHSRP